MIRPCRTSSSRRLRRSPTRRHHRVRPRRRSSRPTRTRPTTSRGAPRRSGLRYPQRAGPSSKSRSAGRATTIPTPRSSCGPSSVRANAVCGCPGSTTATASTGSASCPTPKAGGSSAPPAMLDRSTGSPAASTAHPPRPSTTARSACTTRSTSGTRTARDAFHSERPRTPGRIRVRSSRSRRFVRSPDPASPSCACASSRSRTTTTPTSRSCTRSRGRWRPAGTSPGPTHASSATSNAGSAIWAAWASRRISSCSTPMTAGASPTWGPPPTTVTFDTWWPVWRRSRTCGGRWPTSTTCCGPSPPTTGTASPT